MKINGYWLGASLCMLIEYAYYIFNKTIYYPYNIGIAFILAIIFMGLAFREK